MSQEYVREEHTAFAWRSWALLSSNGDLRYHNNFFFSFSVGKLRPREVKLLADRVGPARSHGPPPIPLPLHTMEAITTVGRSPPLSETQFPSL